MTDRLANPSTQMFIEDKVITCPFDGSPELRRIEKVVYARNIREVHVGPVQPAIAGGRWSWEQ